MPQVIHLTRYEKIPKQRGSFSRRTLFQRDGFLCQYCGCRPGTEELTVDHVVPRVQGGKTEWENCVASCIECNAKKAGRTPKQAGMKLNCVPQKPPYNIFKGRCKLHKSWEPFLKHIDNFEDLLSEAYWDVPLH
jgi:5-methylcytosine-specific restriction endonuclease McrA